MPASSLQAVTPPAEHSDQGAADAADHAFYGLSGGIATCAGLGKLAHGTGRIDRQRWLGPDPRDREAILTLQECVRAHAARGATLGRVLGERRDLRAPRLRAGKCAVASETVATTDSVAGSTTPKKRTDAPELSLTPAMPPAGAPCGRTAEAEKCSSCASVVTNTSSASSGASAAPTTVSPCFRPMTSRSGRTGSADGTMRLTVPWAVPMAIGVSLSNRTKPRTRSPFVVIPR